jgi:hypothetical protein
MTKANEPPKGLPALRSKRPNHAELQPVSKNTKRGKRGYVQ